MERGTLEDRIQAVTPIEPVLQVRLSVDYPQKAGVLLNTAIDVNAGEIVGLVGESGSGKSTLALSILKLLDHTGARVHGSVLLDGAELMPLSEREMRRVRGKQIALIPQAASSALNRALRIGTQLREAWKAHSGVAWSSELSRIKGLLRSCGLPDDDPFLNRYPDQISLGQAQRVLIVMALLHHPTLLIADEPTSALDVHTQREVLDLFKRINREQRMSVLFISHDLSVVAALCQRIAILHDGVIVESGPVSTVLASPMHAYTQKLVAAVRSFQLMELCPFPRPVDGDRSE